MDLTARINDDATITEFVTSSYDGVAQRIVFRVRPGSDLYLRPGYFGQLDKAALVGRNDPQIVALDAKTVPVMHLKVEWIEK